MAPKKTTPALPEAFAQLASARKQANRLRKEIERLRNLILGAGGNPDPPGEDMVPRNKEIFKKWKDGIHIKEIGKEYSLSAARVRQICMHIEVILERKGPPDKRYQDLLPYRD